MQVAVIGKGKTGHCVSELLAPPHQITGIYGKHTHPTLTALRKAEVAIVFVPGEAMIELIPILLAARIPVVCGATDVHWPKNFPDQVSKTGAPWVIASNFSLSMCLIHHCLAQLKNVTLFWEAAISIDEVHHAGKKDMPSGTALMWQKWLGLDCPITAQRRGDEKGTHTLTIKTPWETITLAHTAHNRELFAHGAIWAAQHIFAAKLQAGVHDFTTLVDRFLREIHCKR